MQYLYLITFGIAWHATERGEDRSAKYETALCAALSDARLIMGYVTNADNEQVKSIVCESDKILATLNLLQSEIKRVVNKAKLKIYSVNAIQTK